MVVAESWCLNVEFFDTVFGQGLQPCQRNGVILYLVQNDESVAGIYVFATEIHHIQPSAWHCPSSMREAVKRKNQDGGGRPATHGGAEAGTTEKMNMCGKS
ncbi:MAG: hypothetical protein MJ000_12245 [Bacteroidales bacterium]|nr:hypothetical protein [Bacteroidales bacterium]